MAQQTINIGASPNDGTGTPLRTAFQYTNSNFSELYTAVGPSGNNIVVPGSATITGALTVDTTTLVVNPAGYPDRVGIGTASPSYDLEIAGAVRSSLAIRGNFAGGTDIAHLRFVNANGSIVGDIYTQNTNGGASDSAYLAFNTISSGTSAERYRIGSDGVATWSNVGGVAGTAMTLNATGLGVGKVPAQKLDVNGTIQTSGYVFFTTPSASIGAGTSNSSWLEINSGTNFNIRVNGGDRFLVDTSGNVGIGVTPSAWFSTWKVLQLGGGSFGGPSDRLFSLQNAIVNPGGDFQYVSGSSTPASGYRQFNGAHDWYTAAAGTSPNTITDFSSPKMTLDASGNLSLANGNLVMGTSGKGIDFSATASGSGTMTSELLNDYEEGTWTASLLGGTTNPTTPVTATGTYTKVGRQVTVDVYFNNVTTTGASGSAYVAGLPFTTATRSVGSVGLYNFDLNTGTGVFADVTTTNIYLISVKTNAAWADVLHNAGANRYLRVTVTYFV